MTLIYDQQPEFCRVITEVVKHDSMDNRYKAHEMLYIETNFNMVNVFYSHNKKVIKWMMELTAAKRLVRKYRYVNCMVKYFAEDECPEKSLREWEECDRYYDFDRSLLPSQYKKDLIST